MTLIERDRVKKWWRGTGAGLALSAMWVCALGVSVHGGQQRPTPEPGEGPDLFCLDAARLNSYTVSNTRPVLGQPVTLTWSMTIPASCSKARITVNAKAVGPVGSLAVYPPGRTSYSVRVAINGVARTYGTLIIEGVTLPVIDGRPVAIINQNNSQGTFVAAIGTRNAFVYIEDNVNLDLTGYQNLWIARGVTIAGGRSATVAGGRIYTNDRPGSFLVMTDDRWEPRIIDVPASGDQPAYKKLLRAFENLPAIECLPEGRQPPALPTVIVRTDDPFVDPECGRMGDDVRITGLRIQGGEMGIASRSEDPSFGITVTSRRNIEIDNCELYGWRGAAVKVADTFNRMGLTTSRHTVRVHDNYIHHNRHYREQGYGVSVDAGAWALIERNVFDYNRHAIKSSGDTETGYFAYDNLVLPNSSPNWEDGLGLPIGVTLYTHQFDVHGQSSCFPSEWSCGTAGLYFDIRYNTFTGTDGDSIKLRGTPFLGMDVAFNVFSHGDLWSGWSDYSALEQTTSGLKQWGNQLDVDTLNRWGESGSCDIDGDGVEETVLATGRTWWYRTQALGQWRYLNRSKSRFASMRLGDVDGDGRCDVTVNGVVSKNGRGSTVRRQAQLLLRDGASLRMWRMNGGAVESQLSIPAPAGLQLAGAGDFDGDSQQDLLWRDTTGQTVFWKMVDGIKQSEWSSGQPGPGRFEVVAIADFDADGYSDLLWRHENGELQMWFRGRDGAAGFFSAPYFARPTYRNEGVSRGSDWAVKGAGDFNGDGRADILWLHPDGAMTIWYMLGGVYAGEMTVAHADDGGAGKWTIQQIADFDNNGRADILWRHVGGGLAIWSDGDWRQASWPTWQNAGNPSGLEWTVAAAADFNFDGRADIFWRRNDGLTAVWFMRGGTFLSDTLSASLPPGLNVLGVLARHAAPEPPDVIGNR